MSGTGHTTKTHGSRPRREAVCLVGWGAIAGRVAALLHQRQSPIGIVAVAVRDMGQRRQGLPLGARLIQQPSDLAETGATLVVEAAGRDTVLPWGRAALSAGADFAVSSTAALAEEGALMELSNLAEANGTQLILPPGALGGIDALAAAGRLGLHRVVHRIVKPARAWQGTAAANLCDLDRLTEATVFFRGTARDAAGRFPQNANVAVISSLAGIGLDRTEVALVADPDAHLNRHELRAEGEFGLMEICLENRPLLSNPKSSEMTALNLVRMIENRVSPIVL